MGRDLVKAFRSLRSSGEVDISDFKRDTCLSTALGKVPTVSRFASYELGILEYNRSSSAEIPIGFWLPECGFILGFTEPLARQNINKFFLDAHGILNGFPRRVFGVHAPVHCPQGVAAFGRDWTSHDLIWLKDKGYPGDRAHSTTTAISGLICQSSIRRLSHTRIKAASTGIK